jgi:predicted dehydrogenase
LIVVVEKPFVTTSAEADRLIDLAKSKGKVLTVFHSRFEASNPNTGPYLNSHSAC